MADKNRNPARRQAAAPGADASAAPGCVPPLPPAWARAGVPMFFVLGLLAIYARMLRFDLVTYDTEALILQNGFIRGGLSAGLFRWAFTTHYGGYYMPLTWVSHALDWQIYGIKTGGHLLSNLLIHIANSLLLLVVLRRMTGSFWRSACVAAIFAFHPQRVESVAWLAERKDVLAAFFWILTLLAYERYARGGFSIFRYGLVLLALVLGLLAKPSVVTLPFLLLLLDFWPLRRMRNAECGMRNEISNMHNERQDAAPTKLQFLILEKVPMLVLAGGWAALTYQAQMQTSVVMVLPLPVRLANVPMNYAAYLGKAFWPVSLSVLYPVSMSLPMMAPLCGAVLLVGAITLMAAWGWRRRPWLTVGWFWFLGILVPMIGIVQVFNQSIADRYTYLSQIGLAIAVVWGATELAARYRVPRGVTGGVAGVVVALMMTGSAVQLSNWRDDLTLWTHAAAATEKNDYAYCNMGLAYSKKGDAAAAFKCHQQALALRPDYYGYHLNVSAMLAARGDTAGALDHLKTASGLRPGDATIHLRVGEALAAMGRGGEAIGEFTTAISINPREPLGYTDLGSIYAERNDWAHAADEFRLALQIAPGDFQANFGMGMLERIGKEYARAGEHLEKAARIDPASPNAEYQLGLMWSEQGENGKAEEAFRAALERARVAGNQGFEAEIQKHLK